MYVHAYAMRPVYLCTCVYVCIWSTITHDDNGCNCYLFSPLRGVILFPRFIYSLYKLTSESNICSTGTSYWSFQLN